MQPPMDKAPISTETVSSVLNKTQLFFQKQGNPTARLDAEILISYGLKLRRIDLYLKHDQPLKPEELAELRELVKRRSQGEPVAYLVARKEFYGHDFKVTPAVLIPRPETEFLVDAAVEKLKQNDTAKISDWGCGSGCIGLSILKTLSQVQLLAVDISEDALAVAKENAANLGVAERSKWFWGPVEDLTDQSGELDMIVANPPYIVKGDPQLSQEVEKYEPHLALFTDEKGFGAIQRWSAKAVQLLKAGGFLAFEVGFGQMLEVTKILTSNGFKNIEVRKDYSGIDRIVIAQRG